METIMVVLYVGSCIILFMFIHAKQVFTIEVTMNLISNVMISR